MWSLLVAVASAAPTAFVGATLHPVSSPPIPDGVVVIDAGVIVAVGPRSEVPVPPDAQVIPLAGKHLIPGLVDTHSHVGTTGDLNEMSGPMQPQVSSIDAIDAGHPSLKLAQAGGLTTVNVMPGSGNLVGGQTAYLKLRDADTVDDLLLCDDRRTEVCGGLKMANGTNPQREGAYPRTRMGAAAQDRQLLLDARKVQQERAAKRDEPRKKKDPAPTFPEDPAKEPLLEVLDGERVVHFHTHRADDVATAIALGREFGFTPVLHHVSEAWKVADLIAETGTPCSLILIDSPGGKEEAVEFRASNARILEEKGVLVALHTDDPITDSRWFLRSAGLAVRDGMSEAGALAALTLNGAKMLGLEGRVGSLEPGKDADLVVLSGPPLSVWSQVEQTWVEGLRVFDRSDPIDLRYAVGGWAVEEAQ